MKRYVIVVDPLGIGAEYPGVFKDVDTEVVAVLAAPEPAEPYRDSWHPENFHHMHFFDGDLDGLAAILRAYQPICLIPGAETGVELADALVELVVPGTGNVPELASARRDKWAMAHALQRAGVPCLRQYCSADPDDIGRWLHENGMEDDRIIIKPPKSAGTDNVHVVPAGEDWRPFFDQIYGQMNKVGLLNEAVLVQEFADGTEYLIDGYSVDGKHGCVDICRYTKKQRGDRIGLYDQIHFLPPDHPEVLAVWPYAMQVLDAVGVRNGCSHIEVINTADGPRLLEVGARPAGGGHNMITKLACGSNHLTRTVDHRVNGEFRESYELLQYVCSVVVSAPVAGIWRNAEIFDGVDQLPTFWMRWFAGTTGDFVQATDDYYTMLGWVVFASTDKEALEADARRIKELEKQVKIDQVR
jgi:biotin carboxylase